jgi:hypothetical protein
MGYYNLSHVTNATTMLGFMQNTNMVVMGGWLGTIILIAIIPILFGAALKATNDTARSITFTAFATFILAMLLAAIGLLGTVTLFIFVIGSALSVAMTWKSA